MAWLTNFLLGRPGFEYAFSANPDSLDFNPMRVSSDTYTLSGRLKERVLRTSRPSITLKSSWFPKTDLDNFQSLLSITDTQLSFIPRTADWNTYLEPNIMTSTTTVNIQESSASILSAYYAAGGLTPANSGVPYTSTYGTITINGVYTNPAGIGFNYYTGGSYADATNTVTLGTAYGAGGQVYVNYSYPGWMVRLKAIKAPITGGRVDLFSYDFQLDGI